MGDNSSDAEKINEDEVPKNSLLINEYQEIGNSWRHDDQTAAQLTSTLLPLGIGAIVLPFAYTQLAKLPVALGSIMMMSFWLLYYLRMEARFVLRFSRAKEIERLLGFEHHLRFEDPGLKTRLPSITFLRIATFIAYCIIWAVLLYFY
jgi:hypothetical protein